MRRKDNVMQATGGDVWAAERGTSAASKLRAVIANAPVALFAIDRRGKITVCDGQGLASMGLRAAEIVGCSAFELYASVELRDAGGAVMTVADAVLRALAGECIAGECTLGGRSFDFRLRPQRDDATGAVHGVVGSATDVTERNETRERLLVADRLAAIGTLAAGAAHEINNPLTYTSINVEHVMRQLRRAASSGVVIAPEEHGDLTPELLEALSRADHGLQRVRDIVRSLLTFSHGGMDRRTLVDLHGVVESSVQMALHEIQQRARLVRELAAVPPVEANETRLGQVFLNLLVNAAQAVPEGDSAGH
jgi:PAS domain S-box-containing protein